MFLEKVNSVFGFFSEEKSEGSDEEIEALLAERTEARKNKNFKRSDEIRDMLAAKGISSRTPRRERAGRDRYKLR